MKIAMLGLGKMGGNMSARLIRNGVSVVGYDNSQEVVKELEEKEGLIPTEYVFENTDSDLVFLQMDIFWTLAAGQDPITLLNKYSNRYKLMHLKDMKENQCLA